MADYNIYVHAIGTGNSNASNPTMPWSTRDGGQGSQLISQNGGSGDSGGNVAKSFISASSFMQNPDSIVGAAGSAISKIFPIVAAACVAVKIAVQTIDTALDFYVLETGNYRPQYMWEDVKRIFNVAMNPVSSTINAYKTERQWAIEEQRARLNRDLLGGSYADMRGI